MTIPGIQALDKIVTDAVLSVYEGLAVKLDREVFARDFTNSIRDKYLSFVIQTSKYVTLIGHHNPVEVKEIFVEPAITGSDTVELDVDPELVVERLSRLRHDNHRGNPALSGLATRTLIVGPPGVGKSTLAKAVALIACNYLDLDVQAVRGKLPFYFAVKDLSPIIPVMHNFDWRLALETTGTTLPNKKYLERLIEHEGRKPQSYIESLMISVLNQANCDHAAYFVEHMLEKGNCCIIVDGLDEASSELKEVLVGSLTHISAIYPSNTLIAFSRPKAIPDGIYGFKTFGVMEFDSERTSQFVDKWFRNDKEKEKFLSMLATDYHIAELARNPLLISIICLLFDRKFPIPQKRSDLYGRCLDALMFELDRAKRFRRRYRYPFVNEQKRKDILSVLAFNMQERGTQSATRKVIEEDLTKIGFLMDVSEKRELGEFVDALELEHGVLVEWARNVFVFPHRTFQEYLAAWHIERSRDEAAFALRLKSRYETRLEQWREVAIILAHLLYDASDYIRALINTAFPYDFKKSLLPDILTQDIACDPALLDLARSKGYLPELTVIEPSRDN